jgi:sodium transport system permease protein
MSLRNIGIVYRKELTDSLRDRRTLISMIVVPIVLMPLMSIGIGTVSAMIIGKANKEVPRVMILGGEDSPKLMEQLRAANLIRIVPPSADYVELISNKEVRAAVDIPHGFDAAVARGEKSSVKIYDYKGELRSQNAADRLDKFFRDLRDKTVQERLQTRSLPPDLIKPFEIDEQNVAPPEKVTGNLVGGLVPYFIILLSLTGAMYPAMDLTAGEKERGTIETILCSPVSRAHLVLGKFLMVLTASVCTAILSILSMSGTFIFAKRAMSSMGDAKSEGLAQLSINPKAVVAVFLMVIPLAVLFSAALFAIALFAKSYKEAQSYISPLMIVVILPAIAAILPGVELNTKLALVPILNTSLVSKEIITGTYHWKYIFMIFASSTVYAAAALFVAVNLFKREDVLFRT